jgi:hypothetical protein
MLLTRLMKRVARVWCDWLKECRTDAGGAKELERELKKTIKGPLMGKK